MSKSFQRTVEYIRHNVYPKTQKFASTQPVVRIKERNVSANAKDTAAISLLHAGDHREGAAKTRSAIPTAVYVSPDTRRS